MTSTFSVAFVVLVSIAFGWINGQSDAFRPQSYRRPNDQNSNPFGSIEHSSLRPAHSFASCSIQSVWDYRVKKYSLRNPGEKVSWYQAKRNCEAEGKRLATIENETDQKVFEKTLQGKVPYGEDVWIGLYDWQRNRRFIWISGNPVNYTNWVPGEPFNWRGDEDCVVAVTNLSWWRNGNKFQWNDIRCDLERLYACEYYEYTSSCSCRC